MPASSSDRRAKRILITLSAILLVIAWASVRLMVWQYAIGCLIGGVAAFALWLAVVRQDAR
jgi:hypothetical protein